MREYAYEHNKETILSSLKRFIDPPSGSLLEIASGSRIFTAPKSDDRQKIK